MKLQKYSKFLICLFLSAVITVAAFGFSPVNADTECTITYDFTGNNADTPGYAEGTITLTAHSDGEYKLYWYGNNINSETYYPIFDGTLAEGENAYVTFDYHTAIPAAAEGIIVIKDNRSSTVYELPENKLLCTKYGIPSYTFSSYSDVHMDITGYYIYAEPRWADALEFSAKQNADFIVTSGDMITNNYPPNNPDEEWLHYEKIIRDSRYNNPVWESDGNHDMHTVGKPGLRYFIKATGTDETYENITANTPYYYILEPKTGDLFIFMALEESSSANSCNEFSENQMRWVESLLDKYYGSGINIYLIEHAPINGFGAGDRMDAPYYKGLLSTDYEATLWLKDILTNYKGIIHLSGHTHEDFCMGYNYSDENGTACNMIHNPAVVGTTMPNLTDDGLDYNNGKGNNSQGYFVEVYDSTVIFYGADLTKGLIYPQYSYIMEGTRSLSYNTPDTPDTPDTPNTPDIPHPVHIVPISGELNEAKKLLDYPDCASYTLYQSLKRLYITYRSELYAPEEVKNEIAQKTEQLLELYGFLGVKIIYPVGDTYYFVNTLDWDNVYAYAYSDNSRNALWPGVKMKKTGILYGHDVFRVRFDYDGQYNCLVFSNGSIKTETITLYYNKNNCFIITNPTITNNYKVASIQYQ